MLPLRVFPGRMVSLLRAQIDMLLQGYADICLMESANYQPAQIIATAEEVESCLNVFSSCTFKLAHLEINREII